MTVPVPASPPARPAGRPFRFGVQASAAPDQASWLALARRVEELGYSTLTMADHFTDQLAPTPALMAAATATERLRVGALVLGNDYRHPVLLAKELATMDLLSNGRLEVGIGAGWMRNDYDQAGLAYDRAGVRIDRLAEALAVLKGLFADGAFSYEGEHYTITGLEGTPKPVQRPHPPILIGGGGRRVLTLAGQQADIVGINFSLVNGVIDAEALAGAAPEIIDQRVAWAREAAGDRDIELNVRAFFVKVTDDREGDAVALARMFGFTAAELLSTPYVLVGSKEQLVDDLLARRERWGFSYVIVGGEDVEAFAPVVAELHGR